MFDDDTPRPPTVAGRSPDTRHHWDGHPATACRYWSGYRSWPAGTIIERCKDIGNSHPVCRGSGHDHGVERIGELQKPWIYQEKGVVRIFGKPFLLHRKHETSIAALAVRKGPSLSIAVLFQYRCTFKEAIANATVVMYCTQV
jgi:hypothetical protein